MDFESALAFLRSVESALSQCDLEPESVLELETNGQLDQLGPAIEAILSCRVSWGGQTGEIKRLASSVSERTYYLKTVYATGERYCRNRLSIGSESYANPTALTPLSMPGKFEAEG